jgi:hypothetical protein
MGTILASGCINLDLTFGLVLWEATGGAYPLGL